MTPEELAKKLKDEQGYLATRVLPDGSVAILHPLLTTYAVCLGATEDAMFTTSRFCYSELSDACTVFAELKSKDDLPDGWLARRPR